MHDTARATALDEAQRPASVPDFRVDGWLVQPGLNRLARGTTTLRVRPQLMDMLTCLARHPGKVVPKDQLLAVVWNDRYVAASGIARCVAELRQALDDDARQPHIIETITKRGYRLIAPVEPAVVPPPVRDGAQAVDHDTGRTHGFARLLRLVSGTRAFLATGAALAVLLRQYVRFVAR